MKKTFQLLSILGILILLAGSMPATTGYQVGDQAADFKLKNVDGKIISLTSNPSAKGYILVFTCNTCPIAQAYEDRIIALDRKYAAKGFPVLAINPNDPGVSPGDAMPHMKKRAEKKQYPFPYLLDEGQEVTKAYGARNTPHVYILTKTGSGFTVSYIGAIDNNTGDPEGASNKYVEKAMGEILAGKPVTTSQTKAIGCGIKWRKA